MRPHGGILIDRVLHGPERVEMQTRARKFRRIRISRRELSDLELIAVGAISPLSGFLCHDDYLAVVREMRLHTGLLMPLPVTLSARERLPLGEDVALCDEINEICGMMRVSDVYAYDRRLEAHEVFRTQDEAHPGVRRLYTQGDWLVGGDIWLLDRPTPAFAKEHLDPRDTRRIFRARGWRTVAGFQTRNPIHRAHEYLQKTALENVDGLLLHPLVGETKEDDVPAAVRMLSYRALLEHYYPMDRTLLAVFPAAMRYAGPREALFHALCRQNYGCTHFIIGRDHAGVGNYYGTYDAQKIFEQLNPGDLLIQPLTFEHAFFCFACNGMATTKTCPHGDEDRLILSGTRVREMLRDGQIPPPEFSRPEVAQILVDGMRQTERSAMAATDH